MVRDLLDSEGIYSFSGVLGVRLRDETSVFNLQGRPMKSVYRISCVVLSILLVSPVTTWAGSCPEGQKWNDRRGECVKGKNPRKSISSRSR